MKPGFRKEYLSQLSETMLFTDTGVDHDAFAMKQFAHPRINK
jgi:hypothetical protein